MLAAHVTELAQSWHANTRPRMRRQVRMLTDFHWPEEESYATQPCRWLFLPNCAVRQSVHAAQQFTLLIVEAVAELVRVHILRALLGRHAAQFVIRLRQLALLVGWQTVILLKKRTRLCLLFRRQMFVRLHPVEDRLLLIRRQAVKGAQPVEQVLLLVGRQ